MTLYEKMQKLPISCVFQLVRQLGVLPSLKQNAVDGIQTLMDSELLSFYHCRLQSLALSI